MIGSNLSDVDGEGLELAFRGLVAFDPRQSADPVAPQASVQRRSREMRDGPLEPLAAVIERQQLLGEAEHLYRRRRLDCPRG